MGVKERYEERQKKGEKSSYSGVRERSIANEIDDVASSISSRTSTWLQNHNNYLSNFNDRYSRRTGTYEDSYVSDAGDWLSTISSQKENFDKEASSILSMLDQYGDYLDTDWADSIRKTLTSAAQQQSDILKHATSDSDYWSQFDIENVLANAKTDEEKEFWSQYGSGEDVYGYYQENYRTQQRLDSYQKKYEGKSYDEIQSAIGELDDGEEKEWLSSYQYDLLGTAEDFGDKSASGWEKYLSDQEVKQQAQEESKENETFWDKLGRWMGTSPDTSLPMGTTSQVTNDLRNDTSYMNPSSNWTEEQRATYGYLYESDKSAAAKYAQATNEANNKAENEKKIAAIEDWATKSGWTGAASTIGAIAMMPLSLADTLNALTEYNARGFVSTSSTPLPGQVSQAITSAISSTLNESYGTLNEDIPVIGGKGLGDAYQLGTSIAESMISGHTQGTLGTYMVFFGSAASNGMYDAKNRGATDEQAITFGVLSGLAEAAGEALSVDNLLSLSGAKELTSFFGNVLKQAGIEASEEGVTTLLNNFADQIVMGDKSNFNILVDQYMSEEGLSEEDAKKKAWKSMANDLAFDMLGGAISGGVSSGLQTGVQTMFVNHTENQNAQQLYGSDPGALVGEALEINPDNTYAQKMQGKLDSGKSLSGGQLNKLVQQNEQALTAQDMQSIQSAAAQRLTELGETGNVDTVAAALAKQAAGEKLSRVEKQAISGSKYASRVANELNTKNIQSGDYSSAWAENIGTERINAQEYSRLVQAAEQSQTGAETAGEQVATEGQNGAQAGQTGTEEVPMATVLKNRTVEAQEEATSVATGKESLQVAEDGVTRQASTGKAVTPQKIVSIDGGKAMIQTDSGTVAAEDIQFGDRDTDLLWRSAVQFNGITTAGANGVIRAYRSGQPVATYLHGASQEFQNGYYNMGSGGEYADKLTPAQREIIYELGQKAAGENTAKAQSKATAAKKAARKGADAKESSGTVSKKETAGKVHFERNGRTFDGVRETALKTMEQLSKALGVEFYVYESYKNAAGQRVYKDANGNEVHAPNGWYVNGEIHIDLNAGVDGKGTMLFTVAHELTHFIREWSPAKFKILANVLVKQYAGKDVSVDSLVQKQIAKAKRNGRTIDYDTAYEEVVADSMEAMLTDGNVVQMMAEVKQRDKSLWQKIRDWFKDLVADLKAVVEAYKGYTPDSVEGRTVAQMQDVIGILEGFYADALLDAGENYQAAKTQKNTTQEGDAKMSVRTVDGNEVVWIEENILKENKGLPVHQFIANYIAEHIGEVYTIIESGQKVYIGEDLPGEYTQSKYTQAILRSNPSISKAKKRAAANLGEMIEIATNRRWEKTRHTHSKDAKYGMYRYDTRFGFPVKNANGDVTGANIYSAELLIRNASDGKKYLYDIVSIKKNTANSEWLTQRVTSAAGKPAGQKGDVFDVTVAQDAGNVKEKFSLRDTVEETKTLVALHNLTEEKLQKAIKLGGFPMPSIAVTKSDIPHTNFGDISLVMSKDTVDPKASRKNTVYSADAWTPTFPQVEYEADSEVGSRISKKLNDLGAKVDDFFQNDLQRLQYGIEENLNRYGGEEGLIQSAMDNYGLKAAYLEEQGQHIEKVTQQKEAEKAYNPAHAEKYQKILEVLGVSTAEEIGKVNLKEARENHGAELEAAYPGITKASFRMARLFGAVKAYLEDTGGAPVYQTVTDGIATKQAVDAALDAAGFEEWVRSLLAGIEKSSGIYNNKDIFTPSGSRRSFKQTHLPVTLENIVKAMVTQNGGSTKNVSGFNGIKTLRAGTAERFKSIEQMHEREGRLQNLTQEQTEAVQDALEHRLYAIIESIDQENGQRGDHNSFMRYDSIGEIITEISEGASYNVADIQRIFQKYSREISDDTALEVKQLLYDVSQMPVNLFEAKPERAVRFDEVLAAIVPSNMSDSMLSEIQNAGMRVIQYEAGNDQDRITKVNSVENAKFSDRDSGGNQLSEEAEEPAYSDVMYSERVTDKETLDFLDKQDTITTYKTMQVVDGKLYPPMAARTNGAYEDYSELGTWEQATEHPELIKNGNKFKLDKGKGQGSIEAAYNPYMHSSNLVLNDQFSGAYTRDNLVTVECEVPVSEISSGYHAQYAKDSVGWHAWHTGTVAGSLRKARGIERQVFLSRWIKPVRIVSDAEVAAMYKDLLDGTNIAVPDNVVTPSLLKELENAGVKVQKSGRVKYSNRDYMEAINTGDRDIRFSERDPELEKVNRVLTKENTELKYDIAYLKEMLKLQKQATGGTKFTKTSVEAAAGQLMKYAGARGERSELAGLLNGVYEYIAKGEELTWDGVKEAAQPAVEWLQSHVRTEKQLDSYAQDVLRDIRGSRIYLDETQKKEAAYQYGSYNAFRQRMMGSVIIANTGSISLDSQWQEWASMYPDIFDSEVTTNDMPGALMDAIDSLRNMNSMDSYGYDQELFGQELLRQVYDSYWDVSTLYTVTDKAQKEINKLKNEHRSRMAALRRYHSEQTAQLKRDHKEDLQKVRREYRERAEKQQKQITERYQESRKKSMESRKKTEMRRKIRRTIMDLNKLLNRGNKKLNVKEDMQDLVARALKAADVLFTDEYSSEDMVRDGVGTELTEQETKYMAEAREIMEQMDGDGAEGNLQGRLDYRLGKLKDVFTRERARLNKTKVSEVLGNLADAYASLENSEYNYVSGAFDENVHQYLTMLKAEVGGTTVKDMSLNQLENLHRAYTMVLTTVRNANKMFAANMKQTREQLGSQTIAEVQKAGGEHGLWLPGEDKVNAFLWNNQKPVYAFERIGSETLTKLFENTRAGEDSWAQDMTDAREYYLEQSRKHKFDSWDFGKQYKFTSTSGIDFTLNLEQIMSLYAYSKREQAHDHLMKGGFVFDSNTQVQVNKMGIKVNYLQRNAKAHNVSPEILGEITGKLTVEQRAFVDEMQDYLSTTMGAKGNEVSMQMYGVELFKEKHYFPLRSAGQYMERAKEADLKKEQGQISIVNSGFTKATTPKSSNPVVLSGFMDVWADHVNEMSMYHSFVLPMEDFRRVYNYASPNMETGQSISVNSVIQDAYGKEATDYIDQLYRDLNGGAVSDPRETPVKALMGKFKKAAVFASLSVVIQQPSAIGRAFAIVDPKYFIGSKVDSKRHKALWAELKKYAPVASIKEMGYFDTGMGKSAQDFIKGKEYNTLKEKAAALITDENYRDELLGKAPALADELTWCAMWEAVKRETKAKNPKMSVSSDEFLQLAGKRFTEVITKTQVYDSVLSRSGNMRSKSAFMNMWTAFMAEPTTTINMVEDALRKGKAGNKKYAARAMGAVLSSVILNSLLVSLVYAMRDDDEDETFLEKYVQSFATEILDGINPLTYYPFLKDIWSVLQGFDIERSDMSLITSLTEALTKLVQVYSKDTDGMDEEELAAYEKSLSNAWWGVVDYATALLGIPVKNVRRDVNGAVNLYKTIGQDLDDRDTSWGSLVDKTWDEVKNTIPVVGWLPDSTAADKLYKATVSGDTAYQKRLSSSYATQTSLDNAIRKGLRANDSRIWEAAIAWNNNDLETYKNIAKEIIGEGYFSQDNVVMAIQAEAKAMIDTPSSNSESKAKGYFTAEKFAVAISQGNDTMAAAIKADIIETAQKNGKTADEAESSFESSAKSELKDLFAEGGITQKQAVNALTDYCGVGEEDAQVDVQYWEFQKEYPEYDLSESAVTKYYENAEPAGISVDVYYDYYTQASQCEGDKDADGNTISGSKKAKILAVIDSLDLTKAQKDALYYANGWAKSTINEAPWH